jgi:hypothetical protein
MTRKETTAIALKCFAIYILSSVIFSLPSLVAVGQMLNNSQERGSSSIWAILIPALSVIIGIATALLIWKTTNSLLTKETSSPDTGEIGVNGVMKIILACMGIYFAINALIYLPGAFVSYQFSAQVDSPNPGARMALIAQGLRLTFGCLLIAMPGRWVKAIRSIGEI